MAELISDDDTAQLKLVRLVRYEGFYGVICGVVGGMSPSRRSSLLSGRLEGFGWFIRHPELGIRSPMKMRGVVQNANQS
jgi:hypothetical protein